MKTTISRNYKGVAVTRPDLSNSLNGGFKQSIYRGGCERYLPTMDGFKRNPIVSKSYILSVLLYKDQNGFLPGSHYKWGSLDFHIENYPYLDSNVVFSCES